MSRKKILIIVAVVLLILGICVYVALRAKETSTSGGTSGGLSSLFPFGAGSTLPTSATPGTAGGSSSAAQQNAAAVQPAEKLVRIYDGSTAGYTVLPLGPAPAPVYDVTDPSGQPEAPAPVFPTIRLAQTGTGYLYDVDARRQNLTQITSTVLPSTDIVLFADGGNTVIYRSIKSDMKTIATFLGTVQPPAAAGAEGQVTGSFLPDNILDATLSPDAEHIFVLLESGDEVAGVSMKSDGTDKQQLFSNPFTEWLSQWTAGGIVLTTKAANDVPGYAYKVTASGGLQKILGDVDGLTTSMSPDGKTLLYSVSDDTTNLSLHILNLGDGTDINTGLSTLPEKCQWSADSSTIYCGAPISIGSGTYPDDWYQGTVNFTDAIWSVNTATGTTTEIDNGEGFNLDLTNVQVDPQGQFLFFVNKYDGSLWSLELPTTTEN